MDTRRLVLFIVFSFSIFFLWDAWQRQQHPPAPTEVKQGTNAQVPQPTAPVPAATTAAAPVESALGAGQRVHVRTDVLIAEIDTVGGDLRRLQFLKHGDPENKKQPFTLFEGAGHNVYVAQTGLIDAGLPNHKTPFTVTATDYALAPNQDALTVRLDWADPRGIKVAKVYTFKKGSYLIDVTYEITNGSGQRIEPNAYFQFLRDSKKPRGDSRMVPTYTGPAVYTDATKFHKVDFDNIAKGKHDYPKTADNGWIAMLQHYFVGAWLPKQGVSREFYTRKVGDDLYTAGIIVPVGAVEPGGRAQLSVPLYAGPQEQDKLEKLAPGFDLVVDYGWLKVIAKPLFMVLSFIYQWVQNWGVAIILLTVLIKLLFFPLSAKSYRSMAQMRVLTPKLQRLKEQYGDDRQRLHQAMMELYKKEQINPLGGCLPIVVQIPVFIALYWVLLGSVEMRQAPFALWIHDLSAQDPYYVLPIIMGITMLIQTKLNPTPPDPIQAKVMLMMPIMFTVFFLFFPAGLVLYWVVNNVLSIAQQWVITRKYGEAKTAAHAKR